MNALDGIYMHNQMTDGLKENLVIHGQHAVFFDMLHLCLVREGSYAGPIRRSLPFTGN